MIIVKNIIAVVTVHENSQGITLIVSLEFPLWVLLRDEIDAALDLCRLRAAEFATKLLSVSGIASDISDIPPIEASDPVQQSL